MYFTSTINIFDESAAENEYHQWNLKASIWSMHAWMKRRCNNWLLLTYSYIIESELLNWWNHRASVILCRVENLLSMIASSEESEMKISKRVTFIKHGRKVHFILRTRMNVTDESEWSWLLTSVSIVSSFRFLRIGWKKNKFWSCIRLSLVR
jgi:hypothetical protein